jgi:hypothetical protein
MFKLKTLIHYRIKSFNTLSVHSKHVMFGIRTIQVHRFMIGLGSCIKWDRVVGRQGSTNRSLHEQKTGVGQVTEELSWTIVDTGLPHCSTRSPSSGRSLPVAADATYSGIFSAGASNTKSRSCCETGAGKDCQWFIGQTLSHLGGWGLTWYCLSLVHSSLKCQRTASKLQKLGWARYSPCCLCLQGTQKHKSENVEEPMCSKKVSAFEKLHNFMKMLPAGTAHWNR